jgi:hypothetical protein
MPWNAGPASDGTPGRHAWNQQSTRRYARIVEAWVTEIGLDVGAYGTHTMRRTKASLIYRRTKNLRAVQLLWGTPNWKAWCGIWVSKSTTALRWPNRPRPS